MENHQLADKHKKLANEICERLSELMSKRGRLINKWQEIATFVYGDSQYFSTGGEDYTPSTDRYDDLFENTAANAFNTLVTNLHSQLTSGSQKWLSLAPPLQYKDDDRLINALKDARDTIFQDIFTSPKVKFGNAMHQFYMSLVAFGTAIMLITQNSKTGNMLYKSIHLGECYIAEDFNENVDTLYRKFKMDSRQILEEFPNAELPESVRKMFNNKPNAKHAVIHAVEPRIVAYGAMNTSENKAFRSIYILESQKIILEESGYDTFPYVVARWMKRTGQVYGRSPAMQAMPSILMLQAIMKNTIQAAEMSIFPPLQVPLSGGELPDDLDIRPGALIGVKSPDMMLKPLIEGQNAGIGIEFVNVIKLAVKETFYASLLDESEKKYLTATEIIDNRDKSLYMLSSVMQRIETEALEPITRETILFAYNNGMLPEILYEYEGLEIIHTYRSPINNAVRASEFLQAKQTLDRLLETASFAGEQGTQIATDSINLRSFIEWTGKASDLPANIIRANEEYEAILEQRAQQEQEQRAQQEALAEAEVLSKAGQGINSLSQAENAENANAGA